MGGRSSPNVRKAQTLRIHDLRLEPVLRENSDLSAYFGKRGGGGVRGLNDKRRQKSWGKTGTASAVGC